MSEANEPRPLNCACKSDTERRKLVETCMFHQHKIDSAVLDERERCARIAETETELPGPILPEVQELFEQLGHERAHRRTVQLSKLNIAKRIRAGAEERNPARDHERGVCDEKTCPGCAAFNAAEKRKCDDCKKAVAEWECPGSGDQIPERMYHPTHAFCSECDRGRGCAMIGTKIGK